MIDALNNLQGGNSMLTAEIIQSMGRKNVSANAELTKQRSKDALKAAKRKQKDEIDALTGLKRISVNRVYATGIITAKVAVAIGQVLNIDPFYLTGEIDEPGVCTDNALVSFLTTKGYPKLAKGLHKSSAAAKTEEPAASAEQVKGAVQAGNGPLFSSAFSNSPELAATAAELPLEEAQQLLNALYIRAKLGGNAAQLLDLIKRSLLM